MDDQNTAATATVSAAEQIMTAAGWRRESMVGNLQAWGKDQPNGEYLLISADGSCDADPLEIIWTCGRYKANADPATVLLNPHHTSLARALEDVAKLTVQEAPAPVVTASQAEPHFADQADRPGED